MSCTRPITAQSYICKSAGISAIRFKGFQGEPNLELPCNKCDSCKLRKAKEWALRCWHESQMHEESFYVTLTYSDEHLPDYHDLNHRHFQLFMKRLRKNTGAKITFYMCGEYGDATNRPHFHALIFGYYPPDAEYLYTKKGNRYYKSEKILKYWRLGFADFSNVSYKNAGYIARYTLKKQMPNEDTQDRYTYLDADQQLQVRKFEYIRCSSNPGIGLTWAQKYVDDWGWKDYILDPNGYKCPVPRYYLEWFRDYVDADHFEKNALARIEKARANPDNSPERLKAKEICVKAKLKQLPRPYL